MTYCCTGAELPAPKCTFAVDFSQYPRRLLFRILAIIVTSDGPKGTACRRHPSVCQPILSPAFELQLRLALAVQAAVLH